MLINIQKILRMYQEDGAAHHFCTVFVRQSFFMFVSLLCKLVNTQFLNDDLIFKGKNYSDLPDPMWPPTNPLAARTVIKCLCTNWLLGSWHLGPRVLSFYSILWFVSLHSQPCVLVSHLVLFIIYCISCVPHVPVSELVYLFVLYPFVSS